jgi:hypothetical protein
MSSSVKAGKNGYLMRKDKDIHFFDKVTKDKSNFNLIAKCQAKSDSYDLDLDDDNDLNSVKSVDERPWIIIRHTGFNNRTGYKIRENDILRLGKSMYKVLEIHIKQTRLKVKQNGTVAEPHTSLRRDDLNIPLDASAEGDNYTGLDNLTNNQGVSLIQVNRAKEVENSADLENK